MGRKRRSFGRKLGHRRYRKIYVIATEGACTEPQYFNMFNGPEATILVECLRAKNQSASEQVLKRMKQRLAAERLQKQDEAWLVVDKDSWDDNQLQKLYQWSTGDMRYGLAVSTPAFEYWLLLHFEDGKGVANLRECRDRLKSHLPQFDKSHVEVHKLENGTRDAIRRAKMRDQTGKQKWPNTCGSTVYRLVELLVADEFHHE